MTDLIPMQALLDKPLDMVFGNEDYTNMQQDIIFLDDFIKKNNLEKISMKFFVDRARKNSSKPLTHEKLIKAQNDGILALRVSALRKRLKLSLREFCMTLAGTPLYQWFCGINRFLEVEIPSKTKINYLENAMTEKLVQ